MNQLPPSADRAIPPGCTRTCSPEPATPAPTASSEAPSAPDFPSVSRLDQQQLGEDSPWAAIRRSASGSTDGRAPTAPPRRGSGSAAGHDILTWRPARPMSPHRAQVVTRFQIALRRGEHPAVFPTQRCGCHRLTRPFGLGQRPRLRHTSGFGRRAGASRRSRHMYRRLTGRDRDSPQPQHQSQQRRNSPATGPTSGPHPRHTPPTMSPQNLGAINSPQERKVNRKQTDINTPCSETRCDDPYVYYHWTRLHNISTYYQSQAEPWSACGDRLPPWQLTVTHWIAPPDATDPPDRIGPPGTGTAPASRLSNERLRPEVDGRGQAPIRDHDLGTDLNSPGMTGFSEPSALIDEEVTDHGGAMAVTAHTRGTRCPFRCAARRRQGCIENTAVQWHMCRSMAAR